MTLEQLKVSHEEHELWKSMCAQLKILGAVTQEDLESPTGSDKTPGNILMNTIRIWGDKLVELKGMVQREGFEPSPKRTGV